MGQAYCPKCKKINPGYEYGRCELVKCTIAKILDIHLSCVEKECVGFVSQRTIPRVLAPSITQKS